jgi:hypothetical protein
MFELQADDGRLIVVLPMRMKHCGQILCVFLNGKVVATFCTFGEAVKHARTLGERGHIDPPAPTV